MASSLDARKAAEEVLRLVVLGASEHRLGEFAPILARALLATPEPTPERRVARDSLYAPTRPDQLEEMQEIACAVLGWIEVGATPDFSEVKRLCELVTRWPKPAAPKAAEPPP